MQEFRGPLPDDAPPAWISEAVADLYGFAPGARIDLPLGEHVRHFTVAGIWRDYARTFGAVVITRPAYIEATHDADANEGSVWLKPGSDPARVASELRAALAHGAAASTPAGAGSFDDPHQHGAPRAIVAHFRSRVCDHLRDRGGRGNHRAHGCELCGELDGARAARRVRHAAPHRHAAPASGRPCSRARACS